MEFIAGRSAVSRVRRCVTGTAALGLCLLLAGLTAAPGQAAGVVYCKLPSTQPAGYICQGTGGDDIIYGTDQADRIDGRGGSDVIYGFEGADRIAGGGGDDSIHAGGGADQVDGENGDDFIEGGGGEDRLKGGSGSDLIQGGEDGDKIDGEGGKDSLSGEDGDDFLRSRDGGNPDLVSCGNGTDRFDADAQDSVFGPPSGDCEISTTVSFSVNVP